MIEPQGRSRCANIAPQPPSLCLLWPRCSPPAWPATSRAQLLKSSNNRVWPTVYVVDRRGIVRYGWEGELSYKGAPGEEKVRKFVDELLLESP